MRSFMLKEMESAPKTRKPKDIKEAVGITAYRPKFNKLCFFKTKSVLGVFLGEEGNTGLQEITDDAIGHAIENTLRWVDKMGEDQVNDILENFNSDENDIRPYLYICVQNEAFKRFRRWKTTGKVGYAARQTVSLTYDDDDNLVESFERWLHENKSDILQTMEQSFDTPTQKVQEIIDSLASSGVPEDVLDYIRLRFIGGCTYQELADEYSGTVSKYKQAISRALKNL
jgi:DNA-directed RNA polymerase specialized sigma24 family protein